MSNNKTKSQSYQEVLASVKEEMAKPRVAESAQVEADGRAMAKKAATP